MVQSPSKKLPCPICKKHTKFSPHPNDIKANPETEHVACEECNRYRKVIKK